MKLNAPSRFSALLPAGLLLTLYSDPSRAGILYSENFDSMPLGPNVEEGMITGAGSPRPVPNVWTKTPPTGWTVDDSQMQGLGNSQTDGVVEWAGWSFADPRWWAFTAENQNRQNFLMGGGGVAITDPDEWDDLTRSGPYNSFLLSPQIPIAAAAGADLELRFDSSWRPESPQKAVFLVSYGGAFTEVFRWEGPEDSAFFHPDSENETRYVTLSPPAGAQKVQFKLATMDAGNNWWWAIDNVVLYTGGEPPHFATHPATPAEFPSSSGMSAPTGSALELFATLDPDPSAATLQWVRMNGATRTVLTGQTADTLSISSLAPANEGSYLLEATNSNGTVRSAPVNVDVVGFFITSQPEPASVSAGDAVSFSVTAEGESPLTYQWFKGPADSRVAVAGATAATFTLNAATLADAGLYSVRVTSPSTTTFSTVAQLTVVALTIEQPPVSVMVEEGSEALFEITASSSASQGTLSYQWYVRKAGEAAGTAIIGATASSLSINPVLRFGSGYYSVKVSNAVGSVTSTDAKLTVLVEPGPTQIFKEDWQSVVLGPNTEEGVTTGSGGEQLAVWSKTAPNGWVVDNSGMPVPELNNVSGTDGVKEWFGWTFAEPAWWSQTAGDQGRSGFLKGLGDSLVTGIPAVVAISDPDEWDDLAHSGGTFNSKLTSPSIPIGTAQPGTVVLLFDSSWQREAPMKARVEVSFDNGAPQEVLRWTYDGPDQHDNNTDETVSIPLNNPAGASSMKVSFTLFDAGNNWFWGIDNILVSAVTTGTPANPPVITSVQYDPATHVVTVKWASVTGRAYKLQYSNALSTWPVAVPGLTGAAGSESTVTVDVDTLFPAGPVPGKLFFRISE